jgi:hypothetical protein
VGLQGTDQAAAQERRRYSLLRAIRQARKVGVVVDVTVAPDGSTTMRFGDREQTAATGNELDQRMADRATGARWCEADPSRLIVGPKPTNGC